MVKVYKNKEIDNIIFSGSQNNAILKLTKKMSRSGMKIVNFVVIHTKVILDYTIILSGGNLWLTIIYFHL